MATTPATEHKYTYMLMPSNLDRTKSQHFYRLFVRRHDHHCIKRRDAVIHGGVMISVINDGSFANFAEANTLANRAEHEKDTRCEEREVVVKMMQCKKKFVEGEDAALQLEFMLESTRKYLAIYKQMVKDSHENLINLVEMLSFYSTEIDGNDVDAIMLQEKCGEPLNMFVSNVNATYDKGKLHPSLSQSMQRFSLSMCKQIINTFAALAKVSDNASFKQRFIHPMNIYVSDGMGITRDASDAIVKISNFAIVPIEKADDEFPNYHLPLNGTKTFTPVQFDKFSIACVLYHVITFGKHLFDTQQEIVELYDKKKLKAFTTKIKELKDWNLLAYDLIYRMLMDRKHSNLEKTKDHPYFWSESTIIRYILKIQKDYNIKEEKKTVAIDMDDDDEIIEIGSEKETITLPSISEVFNDGNWKYIIPQEWLSIVEKEHPSFNIDANAKSLAGFFKFIEIIGTVIDGDEQCISALGNVLKNKAGLLLIAVWELMSV